MWCTSSRRRSTFHHPSLVVDQVDIKPLLSARDLDVQLRADLSVADHISQSYAAATTTSVNSINYDHR